VDELRVLLGDDHTVLRHGLRKILEDRRDWHVVAEAGNGRDAVREALTLTPDVVVLEVGMGGRLDATNALDTDCALIVSVDLDHREWLGETREAIGREKAGIVRSGKPVVIGDRAVPASVLEHAAEVGAVPYLLGRDFDFRSDGSGWRRARDADAARPLPLPPYGGAEQLANAASCEPVFHTTSNNSRPRTTSLWRSG